MSYLTCPTCRFTVVASAARSPFQNCPRCLLRHQTATMMIAVRKPKRFGRSPADVERIGEAKARLRGQARGAGSA